MTFRSIFRMVGTQEASLNVGAARHLVRCGTFNTSVIAILEVFAGQDLTLLEPQIMIAVT